LKKIEFKRQDQNCNEFHLWFTRPEQILQSELLESYRSLLTEAETEKQQRYVFEKDRHDALITRAFVRDILSKYVAIKPQDLCFTIGDKGKPELTNTDIPIRFNISHTKDLIICAVTLHHDIGCDVEVPERKSDVIAIADRFFSEIEVKELTGLPLSQQRSRFFDYWTLKESYIKAWGQGLAIPLSDFSFHIGTDAASNFNHDIKLSFSSKREDNTEDWQSWLFYPSEEHRIAVSIRNCLNTIDVNEIEPCHIRYFEATPLLNYEERDEL
jgi:4'-phosphopantetheinyl transferase